MRGTPHSRYAAKVNGWTAPIANSDIFLWEIYEVLVKTNWDKKANGPFKRARRPWEQGGADLLKGKVVPLERGKKIYAVRRLADNVSEEEIRAHNVKFLEKQREKNGR